MGTPRSSPTTTTSKAEPQKQQSKNTISEGNKKPLSETKWPCANCHALVKATDDRCPTCHGIQVKIKGSPANNKERWVIERVSPVSVPRETPLPEKEEEEDEIDIVEVEDDDDLEVSVATPDHISEDGEENRPHNPVAAMLFAAAPSPAPIATKGKEEILTNIQVSGSSQESEGRVKRKGSPTELEKESKIQKTVVEMEEASSN